MTSTSPDRIRVIRSFKAAANLLRKSLPKESCRRLSGITFPDFEKSDNFETKVLELKGTLDMIIQARSVPKSDLEKTKNVGDLVLGWFRASYPFASLFLSISKEGSSVSAPGRTFVNGL